MTNSASTKVVTHLGDRFMPNSSFARYSLGERTLAGRMVRNVGKSPHRRMRIDGHRWTRSLGHALQRRPGGARS